MQRVLITGASRGIGFEFVRQYLARGDQVFATCRDPDSAVNLWRLRSERLRVVTLDVSDEGSIESSYAVVRSQTDALDLLINNAGIEIDDDRFGSLNADSLLHILNVNAVAPILIAQRYRDLIARGTNPKIVGITSGHGSLTDKPDGGAYGYSASKAALNMFMRTLAFDFEGVTSFALDPGWVRTDMGGRSAWLSPEESVSGMIGVIDRVTPDDTGKFMRWDGTEAAW